MELPNRVLLLDGGLSNELNHRVRFDVHSEPLWTAKALYTEPESVLASHTAYIQAGADIIETASYQATVEGFKQFLRCDINISEKLICDSVILAKTAVIQFMKTEEAKGRSKPVVAGSIGPYGVFLRDGSEYTGRYMQMVSKKQLEAMHAPRILSLVRGGADLIAIETMPSLEEVEVILNIVKELAPETNVWVSFSIRENNPSQTAYGDSMELALNTISNYPQVVAFGINCCKPEDVSRFLKELQSLKERGGDKTKKLKTIVYPNSGQEWSRGKGWSQNPVASLDTYVNEWIELGANIIGGCCQVGPDQIVKMKSLIDAWNLKNSPQ